MLFFFFNDTATTEIYTLSLHDALPILWSRGFAVGAVRFVLETDSGWRLRPLLVGLSNTGLAAHPASPSLDRRTDRKSTRLNSSHANISYAVFCLKKKKITPLLS